MIIDIHKVFLSILIIDKYLEIVDFDIIMANTLEHFKDDNLTWNKRVFPTKLSEEEKVILVVRQDVIILFFQGFKYLLAFLFILIFKIALNIFQDTSLIISLVDLTFYTVSVIMLALFSYEFHNYYLSLQIVTNRRLIDVDQAGLFHRVVNELPIEKIEDVTYTQSGILPSVFHYGTVKILSAADNHSAEAGGKVATEPVAGGDQGFVFENVPYPAEIQAVINTLFHQSKVIERHQNAFINAQYMNQMMTSRDNAQNSNQVNTGAIAQNQNLGNNKANF